MKTTRLLDPPKIPLSEIHNISSSVSTDTKKNTLHTLTNHSRKIPLNKICSQLRVHIFCASRKQCTTASSQIFNFLFTGLLNTYAPPDTPKLGEYFRIMSPWVLLFAINCALILVETESLKKINSTNTDMDYTSGTDMAVKRYWRKFWNDYISKEMKKPDPDQTRLQFYRKKLEALEWQESTTILYTKRPTSIASASQEVFGNSV